MTTLAAKKEESALDVLRRIWETARPMRGAQGPRRRAIRSIARVLYGQDDMVVMDTETTGLDKRAEAVEVAIVGRDGEMILHTLIRPMNLIPEEATKIHGITNRDIINAPMMDELAPTLIDALAGRLVVTYNDGFDFRILNQTMWRCGVPKRLIRRKHTNRILQIGKDAVVVDSACLMKMYATWHGEWNDYYRSYTYQKLTKAMDQARPRI